MIQQITKYVGDTNIEAALRTHIQRCSNAHFAFSGSHRHLMGAMFTSPARPFYQSVTLINLPPISVDKYTEFCCRNFEEANKHLDIAVVSDLYKRFDRITSYMQLEKDFITYDKGIYQVYDQLFLLWLQRSKL